MPIIKPPSDFRRRKYTSFPFEPTVSGVAQIRSPLSGVRRESAAHKSCERYGLRELTVLPVAAESLIQSKPQLGFPAGPNKEVTRYEQPGPKPLAQKHGYYPSKSCATKGLERLIPSRSAGEQSREDSNPHRGSGMRHH